MIALPSMIYFEENQHPLNLKKKFLNEMINYDHHSNLKNCLLDRPTEFSVTTVLIKILLGPN
jgi:hypothetical protein